MNIISSPPGCLRVYQQNLLGYYDASQKSKNKYSKRMQLLIETITLIRPDIAIFEESMPDAPYLAKLLAALGSEYRAVCAFTNSKKFHQVVIVTHLPQEDAQKVNLRADNHSGVYITLLWGKQRIGVGAIHSTWKPMREAHRMVQGSYLRKALKNHDHAIIAGDFNMVPFGPSVQEYYKAGYKSAYKEIHNREAESFPTNFGKTLYTKGYLFGQQFVSIISGNGKQGGYCLDYVFTRGFVARNCQLIGTEQVDLDISDHSGLVADLSLDK
jgi:endonuclease/exonuclease/phosphatase (EEP) superfamily protein YafD